MLFKTVKFVVICYVSKRKLIHNPSKKSSIFLPNSFTVNSDIGIIILNFLINIVYLSKYVNATVSCDFQD